MQRILIVPDVHAPYHDRKAFDLMLKVARAFKPNIVVVLGDFFDMYSVSCFRKDPRRERGLLSELAQGKSALHELETLGAKRKVFIAGNHENRLEAYIQERARALHDVVKLPAVLGLKEAGWEYIPYGKYIRIGKVVYTHDTGRTGRYCAFGSLQDARTNIVVGHAHSFCWAIEGDVKRTPRTGLCPGWLGDPHRADYMHELKANREWTLGFALGYLRDDGVTHLLPIPIINGTAMLEGRVYSV